MYHRRRYDLLTRQQASWFRIAGVNISSTSPKTHLRAGKRLREKGVWPLSSGVILPVAKSLYLCDGHLGYTSRKTDLMGVFDSIRPQGGYPHVHPAFAVFARLAQGLGTIPFRVDIRLAASGQFVTGTLVQHLVFPDRDTIVNMVVTMNGVCFPQPGIFLVELLLDNQWVADTTVELK
jgi:hypothetical protein